MGVPKFFRWLSERYPCVLKPLTENTIPSIDNLYLDMNGIIHNCTHSNDEDKNGPIFIPDEKVTMLKIFQYIEKLFSIAKPRQYFFMAVDGVAPRAKMNQQRSRRFRSAQDAANARKEAIKRGEKVPDPKDTFDSNCITPGTEFMARLSEHLRFFISKKMQEDIRWQKCKVIFSGPDVPGEGEHKIMEFIRARKSQKGYPPNETHCLYGLDADLIMLSLVSHEPHFVLLREEVRFDNFKREKEKKKKKVETAESITVPSVEKFHLLHISLLREYLELEFKDVKLNFKFDLERVIDDFVLLCFCVGNDFIPHLPTMDIREGVLHTLFQVYKSTLEKLPGYLTEYGKIHFDRVEEFFKNVAKGEKEVLETRFLERIYKERKKYQFKKRRRAKSAQAGNKEGVFYPKPAPLPKTEKLKHEEEKQQETTIHQTIPETKETEGEILSNVQIEQELKQMEQQKPVEQETQQQPTRIESPPTPDAIKQLLEYGNYTIPKEQLESELEKQEQLLQQDYSQGATNVFDFPEFEEFPEKEEALYDKHALLEDLDLDEFVDEKDTLLSSAKTDGEGLDYDLWRVKYYKVKMNVDVNNKEQMEKMKLSYIESLQWVYDYYYHGCVSWNWFYPYHYAPLASDLTGIAELSKKIKFDLGEPFTPFQQLLSVLPPKSAQLLPEAYRHLVLDPKSPIKDFYPEEFEVDMEGSTYEWEGVALLPFIDEKRLIEAVNSVDKSKLTQAERERDKFGKEYIITYDKNTSFIAKSTLPQFLSDIIDCHAKFTEFKMPSGKNFKPVLCEGVKLASIGLEGFPSFATLPHKHSLRQIGVNVHGLTSKKPTMLITIGEDEKTKNITAGELAPQLLGKKVYIGYPYPREAIVSSICDINYSYYHKDEQEEQHSNADKEAFTKEAAYHQSVLMSRWGIDVGEVRVLVYVRLFKEMRKGFSGKIVKAFYNKEFAYPYQLLVPNYNPVRDERFKEQGPQALTEEFGIGTGVIFLGDTSYFGCKGIVTAFSEHQKHLEIKFFVPKYQPQYPKHIKNYATAYFRPLRDVSHKLHISHRNLNLITGRLNVNYKDKRVDLGLNFKDNVSNTRIFDYARKRCADIEAQEGYFLEEDRSRNKPSLSKFSIASYVQWEYSDKAIQLIQEYMQRFPKLFKALERIELNGKLDAEMLFPENTEKHMDEILEWLSGLPHMNYPKIPCDVEVFPTEFIQKAEASLIEFAKKNKFEEIVVSNVSPSLLYKPPDPFPFSIKRTDFGLGHRVVNMSGEGSVPFGARGVIVGLHGSNAEVLFDEEFMGGNTLKDRITTARGSSISLKSLLNLTNPKCRFISKQHQQPIVVKRIKDENSSNNTTKDGTEKKLLLYNPTEKQPSGTQKPSEKIVAEALVNEAQQLLSKYRLKSGLSTTKPTHTSQPPSSSVRVLKKGEEIEIKEEPFDYEKVFLQKHNHYRAERRQNRRPPTSEQQQRTEQHPSQHYKKKHPPGKGFKNRRSKFPRDKKGEGDHPREKFQQQGTTQPTQQPKLYFYSQGAKPPHRRSEGRGDGRGDGRGGSRGGRRRSMKDKNDAHLTWQQKLL